MSEEKRQIYRESLVKSSFLVGSMTFLSRISGFARDVVFANFFGAGSSTDAFFIAFKIPNFFRRLFAEGAFIQSFVPILNDYKSNKQSELKSFISYVQGNLSLVLLLIVTLGVIFSDSIIGLFAPGFSSVENRFELSSEMLQITFPYLFFISLTALTAGIFNTYDKFFLPAITPVLLNLSLIVSTVFASAYFQEPILALAYGVLIAGIVQYVIQIPLLVKMNLFVLPRVSLAYEGVNRVIKLMLPAMLGTAVVQINLIIDSIVASLLTIGSISWLYYSDRLVEFPLGVFGIAIATVILPRLSKHYSENSMNDFTETLVRALKVAIVFSLPAMFGLLVLSELIISTLFQYGSFNLSDTQMSSLSLLAYSLGLPAFILMKVLLTGYFSRQNTKTPVKFGIIAVLFNISMNLIVLLTYLNNPYNGAHALLALATSVSAWIQVLLLYNKLQKDKIISEKIFINKNTISSIVSCLIMSIALISLSPNLNYWVNHEYYTRGIFITGYIVFGATIYYLSMKVFKNNFEELIYGNN